jgi:hypothetical protein
MLMKVNGRTKYFDHLQDLVQVSRYEWTVKRNDTVYTIYGGKHAGGRRNEWYVETQEWNKPIQTESLVDSLTMLDTM